jgi:hypothetical protein
MSFFSSAAPYLVRAAAKASTIGGGGRLLVLAVSRPAAFVACQRAAAAARMSMSTAASARDDDDSSGCEKMKVPPEDYYDGHLMADHLEYLDDMIEHAHLLERHLDDLQVKHLRLLSATSNIKWMDAGDIEALFGPSRRAHSSMSQQLQQTRHELAAKVFAVDAPDGTADGRMQEEMREIQHIIDDAAIHEDASDIVLQRSLNAKVFAVDAPDGQADGGIQEELIEVQHMIKDAAVLEDPRSVRYQHDAQRAIRKDRARDPEHDW